MFFFLAEFCSPHHCHDLLNKCPWEAKGSWTNSISPTSVLSLNCTTKGRMFNGKFSAIPLYISRPRKALVPQKHFWNILCVKKKNIADFKILKLRVRTKLRLLVIFFQITDYPSISPSFLGQWISFHIKYILLRECYFQRTKNTYKKEKSPNILTSSIFSQENKMLLAKLWVAKLFGY